MQLNIRRLVESFLVVGLLIPSGMLLAAATPSSPALTSATANWFDVQHATNVFSQMKNLAVETRSQLTPIRMQEYEIAWQLQAVRLNNSRTAVNQMCRDLRQLDATRADLAPWQRSLVNKVTPDVHEMVYQMDAAIHRLNYYQDSAALDATPYPQNIAIISKNAKQVTGTIKAVTQYAHVEQNMSALEPSTSNARS
jgi:hypothetical protein